MSPQSLTAPPHPPFSKFGHPPLPHPIDASGTSSLPVPQLRFAPPHFLSIEACSFATALLMLKLALGSGQGTVIFPVSTPSLHFCRARILACANRADALAISRSQLTASAWARLAVASATSAADATAE